MKPKLLAIIVANLFVAAPLAQAAGLDWSGSSISIGGQYVNEKSQDPSKLNEYRDLDDLAAAWEIDRAELEAHMAEKGFHYLADVKQFR